MNIKNLHKIIIDQPRFRHKQVNDAIFRSFISSWEEASNLPKSLKEQLIEECPLEIDGEVLESKISTGRKREGTVKAIIKLEDGLEVESVLMLHDDNRNTVCVSSQVGCPLGCKFCATGQMGFRRNLTEQEIVEQVLFFARYLKKNFGVEQKVTNIVFMGMGEPFLNYESVWSAIRIFNSDEKFGIGARRISISTAGILEGIKKMTQEALQVNLAVSLHAPTDRLRTELMPINKNNSLERVMQAVDKYIEKTNRKVMFEYVLIHGVNDTADCAKELAKLMENPLYFVNLIVYNKTGDYKPSSAPTIESFRKILEKGGVALTVRHHYGGEIQAACGQLGGRNKLEVRSEKEDEDASKKKDESIKSKVYKVKSESKVRGERKKNKSREEMEKKMEYDRKKKGAKSVKSKVVKSVKLKGGNVGYGVKKKVVKGGKPIKSVKSVKSKGKGRK